MNLRLSFAIVARCHLASMNPPWPSANQRHTNRCTRTGKAGDFVVDAAADVAPHVGSMFLRDFAPSANMSSSVRSDFAVRLNTLSQNVMK